MVENRPQAVPALLAFGLLVGCTGSPPSDPAAQAPPPPPSGQAAAAAAPAPPAAASTGLVPLPTARQVIASLPVGRRDPFASPLPPLPPPPAEGVPGSEAAAVTGAARRPEAGASVAGSTGVSRAERPQPLPPLTLPPGFRVTGVIRSGGVNEAVVEFGPLSGSLRPGDRGGRTTDLLPGGWSVASVDVNRGRVTLQRGEQRVTAEI